MRRWQPAALLALGLALASLLAIGIGRALPPGDQILFESETVGISDLMLVDVARALVINLTRSPTLHEDHAAWSSDGTQLAYIRQEADQSQPRQVCVRRLPSTSERCLPSVARWDDNPRWSPDGSWLLIESMDETFGTELYRLSPNDGQAEALTRAVGNDMSARLSPDGQRIVFVSQRDGLRRLYVMDGTGAAHAITSATSNAASAAWSPDGRWIAYLTDRDLREELYLLDAACLDQPGCDENARRITYFQALIVDMSWSPDSRTLAFVSLSSGDFDLFTLEIDSGDLQRWSSGPSAEADPAWSPDGEMLAFISSLGDGYDVYIQTAPDAQATRLTDGSMNYWTPLWRPHPTD